MRAIQNEPATNESAMSKVPAVTLGFRLIKIVATTLGETGGDTVTMAVAADRAYFATRVSRVLLFWLAFILTRPLGATVGDYLDKPRQQGGLDFSRPLASAVLLVVILGCIILLPQRAAGSPSSATRET